MPIYEYLCPEHGKFEEIRTIAKGRFGRCPDCNHRGHKVPSIFSFKFFNPFFVDGEGFTSNYMRREAIAELDQELRER